MRPVVKRLMSGRAAWLILLSVISVALFSPTILSAQVIPSVKGRVIGKNGDPKSFVSVELKGPERHSALTNAKGEFSIEKVTRGVYLIVVKQGDYVQKFPSKKIESERLDPLTVNW